MKFKYDAKVIIERINKASKQYKENFIGKTFLILYEGKGIEIMFKADNFLHLCGVDTTLRAKDFYRKAIKAQLKENEIGFSNMHPYILADIKTQHLIDAFLLLKKESLVLTDVSTQTKTYKLGTTDLEVVICFDSQFNDNGDVLNNVLIPYSLRVEEIANSKFNEIYEVDFVLSKETGMKEYNCIEFGNKTELKQYLLQNGIENNFKIVM